MIENFDKVVQLRFRVIISFLRDEYLLMIQQCYYNKK